jgi:ferric-dicitrate binding protein FerR (iron transport regulator)
VDNASSHVPSSHQCKQQHRGLQVAVFFLALILPTTALAQSGRSDLSPLPPFWTMVYNWLHAQVADARKAQFFNQNTLYDCRALLDRSRNAHNATAIAAAQRAVATAEESLRKNRLREQRALKAISWVERMPQEKSSSTRVAGFMPLVEGAVEIQLAGGGAARPVTDDTPPVLGPGDTLRTGLDGRADILLEEGGLLSLNSGSALVLIEGGYEALSGEIRCSVQRKFEIRTHEATMSVRGTEFVLREVPGKPTAVVVIDGTVAFSDIKGAKTVLVGAGQQSYLLPDGTPAEPTKANLQEMKKWWEE